METAVVFARLIAFAAGAALFGAPLFLLYGLGPEGGARPSFQPWLIVCAALAVASALGALVAQTGVMAGDPAAGLDPSTLRDVLTGEAFGASIVARAGAGFLAFVLLLALRPGRTLWAAATLLGGVSLAALAWSGHGGADEGTAGVVHAGADVIHLLAAGVWLGALAGFLALLAERSREAAQVAALQGALHRFSGVGSLVVAAIVASGLVNSWFLVGLNHLGDMLGSPWGWLLLVKLALFAGMLGFAALNRFRLTPNLAAALPGDAAPELRALSRSIALETATGVAILALVAVLGVLAPPASS